MVEKKLRGEGVKQEKPKKSFQKLHEPPDRQWTGEVSASVLQRGKAGSRFQEKIRSTQRPSSRKEFERKWTRT